MAALLQGELGLPPGVSQALVRLHGDEVEAALRRDPYDALMQVGSTWASLGCGFECSNSTRWRLHVSQWHP